MNTNFSGRSFLTLLDFSSEEIQSLLDLSGQLKEEKRTGIRKNRLAGKNVALLFEKPSTRTRAAFAVACADEGAFAEYMGKHDIHLGRDETVKDTARVLGRMFDGIAFRGFKQESVENLAAFSGVPVWNGLTDSSHPTQVLADFLTIRENLGKLEGVRFAYVGDGRSNVANSLMIGAVKMGMDFRIVTDKSLFPSAGLVEKAKTGAGETSGNVTLTTDIVDGVANADVIYNDVWASMGEEDKIPERIQLLGRYQVNLEMIEATGNSRVIYLHCLPCNHTHETELTRRYPDLCETADDVFEGPHSRVFDQAENRLHTIKAVMVATLG